MSTFFSDAFRANLRRAIARIEQRSHAELVVTLKSRIDSYSEYPLGIGSLLAFLVLSYFRFTQEYYEDWIVYAGTVAGFVAGALLTGGIPALLRLLIGRKRLDKSAEIMARAYFQKGGIHHTRDKTGILILVALWEKRVVIIFDRGVESAIPPTEMEIIQNRFGHVFSAKNPADELIAQLESLELTFSRYIPQVEGDVNELPDNLEIDL